MRGVQDAAASQIVTGPSGTPNCPAFAGMTCPPFGTAACYLVADRGRYFYFIAEKAVGVLPVTWRNACEKAGTLA